MSFLDHLEELRRRLVRSLIALVVGFAACFNYAPDIFHFMTQPLKRAYPQVQFIYTEPAEAIMLYMKMAFFVGIFLAAPYSLPAAAQFEGSVSYTVGAKQTPMTQTYKGGMVRTDFSGARGSGAMIMDMNAKTMKMVMPEQKMYMSMDLSGEKMESQGPRKPPKFTDTGKTETIAGKECSIYRYAKEEGKPDTMEMCVAKGMGFFMAGRSPMGRGQGDEADMSELSANSELMNTFRDGFFPLRISKIDGANLKTTMIATKIEAKSVDASTFAVPSDYTEMKMPAGMGPRN